MTKTGTLVWSPELRFTATGTALCSFRIREDDGKNVECEAWGYLGNIIAEQYVKYREGIRVTVTGRESQREYYSRLQAKNVTRHSFVVTSITTA